MARMWGERARAADKQWKANRREARELRGKMNAEIPNSFIDKLIRAGRSDAQIMRALKDQGLRDSEARKAANRVRTQRGKHDQAGKDGRKR